MSSQAKQATETEQADCRWDLDLDTDVGILDLFILFENWTDAVPMPSYSAPGPPSTKA